IRDRNVTGVQTCALPILLDRHIPCLAKSRLQLSIMRLIQLLPSIFVESSSHLPFYITTDSLLAEVILAPGLLLLQDRSRTVHLADRSVHALLSDVHQMAPGA